MRPHVLFPAALVFAVAGAIALAHAQAPAATANPVSAGSKAMFQMIAGYVTRSADKVGEDLYSFKPTPEVRSFGQLIGHVAEENFGICATAAGEKPPMTDIEKTKTTKADLVSALAASVAYCNKIYSGMTDARGAEVVPFFGQLKLPRTSILDFNVAHDYEHYGNMVTYMRLKGIVPPSSEKGGM